MSTNRTHRTTIFSKGGKFQARCFSCDFRGTWQQDRSIAESETNDHRFGINWVSISRSRKTHIEVATATSVRGGHERNHFRCNCGHTTSGFGDRGFYAMQKHVENSKATS